MVKSRSPGHAKSRMVKAVSSGLLVKHRSSSAAALQSFACQARRLLEVTPAERLLPVPPARPHTLARRLAPASPICARSAAAVTCSALRSCPFWRTPCLPSRRPQLDFLTDRLNRRCSSGLSGKTKKQEFQAGTTIWPLAATTLGRSPTIVLPPFFRVTALAPPPPGRLRSIQSP